MDEEIKIQIFQNVNLILKLFTEKEYLNYSSLIYDDYRIRLKRSIELNDVDNIIDSTINFLSEISKIKFENEESKIKLLSLMCNIISLYKESIKIYIFIVMDMELSKKYSIVGVYKTRKLAEEKIIEYRSMVNDINRLLEIIQKEIIN